ncbi:hypothetical protein KSF_084370 [Reticulibacter mediterranei]|uniref:Uncharacterized protein n=1 Tax=Reticulibacter mediterranei TaxID=2778369 RepID=A0A8J3IV16_9CHLR|nr:hypothetical protein [Reticulibacter mediterranei]GHO98389.1 hypothetical protein KSF_084370 [Reticulibacter mediterranei]
MCQKNELEALICLVHTHIFPDQAWQRKEVDIIAVNGNEEKKVTRYELLEQIRQERGSKEQTEILIDYIQELWETIDLLKKTYGEARTQEILTAFSSSYLLDDN